jgi:hypothetical protein
MDGRAITKNSIRVAIFSDKVIGMGVWGSAPAWFRGRAPGGGLEAEPSETERFHHFKVLIRTHHARRYCRFVLLCKSTKLQLPSCKLYFGY